MQRWINRDPIGEAGGVNLYDLVLNDPLIWVDSEGLAVVVGFPRPIPASDTEAIECRGGKLVPRNNNNGADRACTQAHEEQHMKDWKERYGENLCDGVKDGYLPVGGGDDYEEFHRKSECKAHAAGRKCRQDLLNKCKARTETDPEKEKARQAEQDYLQNAIDSDTRIMDNLYHCKAQDLR